MTIYEYALLSYRGINSGHVAVLSDLGAVGSLICCLLFTELDCGSEKNESKFDRFYFFVILLFMYFTCLYLVVSYRYYLIWN